MSGLHTAQAQIVILLGPPGAGKGSQATLIQKHRKIAHISTGNLLRAHIKEETPRGKKAKGYIDRGELVPDNLIFAMLFERTTKEDCKEGYLLDGFPRNLNQAQELQKRLLDHEVIAINLNIGDKAILERIAKRQICKKCQTPHQLTHFSPKTPGICGKCGGKLYQRPDDTEEIVKNRLKVYLKKSAPLIDFYKEKGILHEVDSTQSKEAILLDILRILGRG